MALSEKTIIKLFGALLSPFKSFFEKKKDIALAKHERDMAILQSQARIAQDKLAFDHAWEMASLQDKDKGLRYLSFIMFTSPILVAVVSPLHGVELFDRLELVPDWILQIWFYMIAGIWGIASLKDTVPQIIQSMRRPSKKTTSTKGTES